VTVVVGEMPDEARTAQRQQRRGQPGAKPPAESVNRLGMTLSEPTAQQREQLKTYNERLSVLEANFDQNALAEANRLGVVVDDVSRLKGLSDSEISTASAAAPRPMRAACCWPPTVKTRVVATSPSAPTTAR
jgi:Zn-dependent oligopeptidase